MAGRKKITLLLVQLSSRLQVRRSVYWFNFLCSSLDGFPFWWDCISWKQREKSKQGGQLGTSPRRALRDGVQETATSQTYFISPICFLSGIDRKELCNSLFSVTFHAALCHVLLCASCSSYKNQHDLLTSHGPPQPHYLGQLGATTTPSQPSVQARAVYATAGSSPPAHRCLRLSHSLVSRQVWHTDAKLGKVPCLLEHFPVLGSRNMSLTANYHCLGFVSCCQWLLHFIFFWKWALMFPLPHPESPPTSICGTESIAISLGSQLCPVEAEALCRGGGRMRSLWTIFCINLLLILLRHYSQAYMLLL